MGEKNSLLWSFATVVSVSTEDRNDKSIRIEAACPESKGFTSPLLFQSNSTGGMGSYKFNMSISSMYWYNYISKTS